MLILERTARKENVGAGPQGREGIHTSWMDDPRLQGKPQRPLHSTANSLDHCVHVHSCVLVAESQEVDRRGFSVMCISGGYHLADHGETSPRRDGLISRGTTTRKLGPRASRFRREGSKQSLFSPHSRI
ncbi:hypothetical protein BDV10DRAFT_122483 [Aspergillus recurvatus]